MEESITIQDHEKLVQFDNIETIEQGNAFLCRDTNTKETLWQLTLTDTSIEVGTEKYALSDIESIQYGTVTSGFTRFPWEKNVWESRLFLKSKQSGPIIPLASIKLRDKKAIFDSDCASHLFMKTVAKRLADKLDKSVNYTIDYPEAQKTQLNIGWPIALIAAAIALLSYFIVR